MRNLVLFVILIFNLIAVSSSSSTHDDLECQKDEEKPARLDAFQQLLERAHTSASLLPISALQNFTNNVFKNIKCGEESHEENDEDDNHELSGCPYAMCINASQVLGFLGVDTNAISDLGGVSGDQFGNATLVLLYHVIRLDEYCHDHSLNTSISLEDVEDFLLTRLTVVTHDHGSHAHHVVPASGIDIVLESIKEHLTHQHHDHQHGDEAHEGHEGEGHDHNNHLRRRRDAAADDDDGDVHDLTGHDHGHHGHDDDDEDDDHSSFKLVVKQRCLSSDAILFYLGEDRNDFVDGVKLHEMASVVLYLLSEGSDIEKKCRMLPGKHTFLENIFEQFSEGNENIDAHGLESMMTLMKINPETAEASESEDHSGHNHRRRRSVDDVMSHSHRHRRQAATSPSLTQCYTASQLMALYDASSTLDQASFQQLCPALVSQSLHGKCLHQHSDQHQQTKASQSYGYGSLSTAIICLCSVFGIVFIPCASHSIYDTVMSLFMGLAVGTLFADGTMHLIPLAMGLHSHEDEGHDHGHGIVVEEHVKIGLAIMAGLYLFYLLEVFMSLCGGHSHDHNHQPPEFSNAAYEDTEKDAEKYVKDAEHRDHNGKTGDASSHKHKSGLEPVAVMIIFGDALHNFADGLAIGAAFSESTSTGIGTSIAVFCHELPHELGDFAVLIKSGLSYKKAVGLNLLSALTAFIGLYVGISIADENDDFKKWIFAVAAGMFYYIALVDVLPLLIKAKGGFTILLNNVGILLGFLIMFIIALVEEHIQV